MREYVIALIVSLIAGIVTGYITASFPLRGIE
jgi:hypothetical protein